MLESKQLPREMVFSQKAEMTSLQKTRECIRLAGDVQDIRNTMKRIRQEQDKALRQANALTARAKQLSERSFARTKISIMLNAVGAAISGGSSIVARKIIGDVIGTIGSLVGFTSLERQITEKLSEARGKMDEFGNFTGQLSHLEDGIGRMNTTRKN